MSNTEVLKDIEDKIASGEMNAMQVFTQMRQLVTTAIESLEGEGWVSVEEMETSSYEGWCWINYKGRVVSAYRDYRYYYLFHRHSRNCYMTECISHVMEWVEPQPPEADQ